MDVELNTGPDPKCLWYFRRFIVNWPCDYESYSKRGTGSKENEQLFTKILFAHRETARDRHKLKTLGITHILNAAEGEWNSVDTGPEYYKHMNVDYYGITAEDTTTFNLSQYFYTAAEYIHQTLMNPHSKRLNINIIYEINWQLPLLLDFSWIEKWKCKI